jgi:hypothetical protein
MKLLAPLVCLLGSVLGELDVATVTNVTLKYLSGGIDAVSLRATPLALLPPTRPAACCHSCS